MKNSRVRQSDQYRCEHSKTGKNGMTTSRQVGHSAARWSSQGWFLVAAMALLTGCGEPMFDNAGSKNSLLEDREACVMEMEKSPAAIAYRQNPTAHPEYVSQVFEDVNRCIEHKGWKQVRSPQEQEQVREAITSELVHGSQAVGLSDPKAKDAFARAVEDRLASPSNSVQSATRKD